MAKKNLGSIAVPQGKPLMVILNEPDGPEPTSMTMEDVFGKWVSEGTGQAKFKDGTTYNYSKGHFEGGLVVARGHGHEDRPQAVCPVWNDEVPYKSVTAVCTPEQEGQVTYWLGYVLGGDCVSRRKVLPDGKVALRADYMCW